MLSDCCFIFLWPFQMTLIIQHLELSNFANSASSYHPRPHQLKKITRSATLRRPKASRAMPKKRRTTRAPKKYSGACKRHTSRAHKCSVSFQHLTGNIEATISSPNEHTNEPGPEGNTDLATIQAIQPQTTQSQAFDLIDQVLMAE